MTTLTLTRPVSLPAKALALTAGVALLTISAKMQVPFWPVPMTLQTLVVLMLGALYGSRLGVATVVSYIALGAAGAPVFATGAGLAYVMGPTGGFLAGFIAAAFLAGALVERGFARSWMGALGVFLLADMTLFAFGLGWLSTLIGPQKAVAAGLVPFLPAEALKIALAASLMTLRR